MKKYVATLLSVLLAFGIACGPTDAGNGSGNGNSAQRPDTTHVTRTDKKLYEAVEHVVVLPDEGETEEELQYAAFEFLALFEEATEIAPELEYESSVTVEEDNFYYFIGKTDTVAATEIDYSYSLLGDSGIVIKTVDNVTYLLGATLKANIYAVYEFMNVSFGYEFYASDEVLIRDGTDNDWLNFDWVYRPNIANPCLMAGELNADSELYYKYRFQNYYETWMAKNNTDVYYAHTYFKILPKSLYGDHTEWYSPDGENLCLTRDPAMIDQFVENCKEVLLTDDTHTYFMLGQEDNFKFCNCDNCAERMEELGGFSSAVMMEFTNEVVRRLNEWMATEMPNRNVIFVTFAYNHTKKPPVTYDEKTKTYLPVSPTVVAEKNLSVQYVINMCDYYAPYETSASITRALDGWSAISDNLTIWEYSTNFENYLDCFDNFNSMADNIRLLSDHGVDYIVEQSAYNTNTTAFSELRLYLWSKLMWDCTLDTEQLIDDFLFEYYKEGYEDIRKYFDALYGHVDFLVAEKGITVRSGGNECMQKNYWSYTKLQELKGYIEDAYAAIEPLKASDQRRYDLLHDRIEKQALWADYWTIKFYPAFVGDATALMAEWRQIAKSYGLLMTGEGQWI